MKITYQRARGGRPFDRYTLELWLRSPRGRRLLAMEERELRRVLHDLFGRHLLQVGSWGRGSGLVAGSEMLHCAVLGTVRDFGAQALAEPERLPVMDKSVDAVVLPHVLEFVRAPHPVLRESSRVLTDRGRLVLLGFNPWSLWALRQRLGLRYRAFPPGGRFVSAGRLCDWLELLDFEVTEIRRYGISFPWVPPVSDDSGGLDRWLSLCSEGYLMVAKKRVIPLTLLGKPVRAKVSPLMGGSAVPGASRGVISGPRLPDPGAR